MAVLRLERGRRQFARFLRRGLDLPTFFDEADRTLAGLVPFDESCWLSIDPGTFMPTSHFSRENGAVHLMDMMANELFEDDVNKFVAMSRATPPAATLYEATAGHPERSARHRRLAQLGYTGDELRAVFLDGESAWGCVTLHRKEGRFEEREVALMGDIGGDIAAGIRRAILASVLGAKASSGLPGLITVRGDGSIESVTAAARRWISEIVDTTGNQGGLPLVLTGIAHQARVAMVEETLELARARVPRRAGGWLLLDGFLMDDDPEGRVAVVIQPATTPEIAELIAEAYGLSRREREVTRLVVYGLSTLEISERLGISPYTVQDHLKAVFEKVSVRSRRELVARLFLHHYAPRLEEGAKIGADGWFAEEPVAVTSGDTKPRP